MSLARQPVFNYTLSEIHVFLRESKIPLPFAFVFLFLFDTLAGKVTLGAFGAGLDLGLK